jgi:hypothetical protein
VSREQIPAWLANLEDEDHQFIKRLVLASGSLKQLAEDYEVSYPTIRLRLDRLIERIRLIDKLPSDDAFHARVRLLVEDGDVSPKVGKELMRIYNETRKGERK